VPCTIVARGGCGDAFQIDNVVGFFGYCFGGSRVHQLVACRARASCDASDRHGHGRHRHSRSQCVGHPEHRHRQLYGALITPSRVLTANHCVTGATVMNVAPDTTGWGLNTTVSVGIGLSPSTHVVQTLPPAQVKQTSARAAPGPQARGCTWRTNHSSSTSCR
jgi:hypothetical protein